MRGQMSDLEILARAAANRDSLQLRALTLEFLENHKTFDHIVMPDIQDKKLLAIAAALLELFATRQGQQAPSWVHGVGNTEPFFLVAAAERMPRLRELCLTESPPELQRHGLYAPPNFLEFA
jgi:hypothetical protein